MSTLTTKLRRDLRRQRAQFAAVVVTVFLGIGLFGASFDAFQNLEDSYAKLYEDLHFADLTVTGGSAERLAARAGEVAGVERITVRSQADLPIRVDGSHKLLGRLVGIPDAGQPDVNQLLVLSGEYVSPEAPDGVLVEQHMADHFSIRPGARIELLGRDGWRTVRVAGIVASAEYIWPARSRQDVLTSPDDFGVVFASAALVEELAGDGGIEQVLFTVSDPSALEELVRLAGVEEATDILLRDEQPSNAALQTDLTGFRELSLLFPALFLTAAGLATYLLLGRLVRAERPLIGMLLANGFERRAVFRHYTGYGLATGLVGATLGAIFGLLVARVITGYYTSAISVPVTVTSVRPLTAVVGAAIGLAVCLLAAALPARAATRIPPAEAMRAWNLDVAGRRSLLERALPPLRRIPTSWKIVLRGAGRNRRRTAYTVVGIMLSLALILVSWGMLDTTQVLIDRQFNEIERQDAEVYFAAPPDDAALGQVASIPGVARVERLAKLDVVLGVGSERYRTTLEAFEPDTQMHEFEGLAPGASGVPSSGIVLGSALRDSLDLDVGDELRVSAPSGDLSAVETVVGFVDEPLGTYAYTSLPALEASNAPALGTTSANAALVRYEPGTDRESMRERLSSVPGVVAFSDSRSLFETVQSFMSLFYVLVGIMLAFGAVMAFALIFNSMSANVAERSSELATLRAIGLSRRSLSRMVTSENMLVSVIALVPGLLVGYEIARLFMASFSSDLFSFDLQMRWTTPVIAAAAVLLVSLLSQWPGLRAIGRLDVATVVRERSL